MTVSYTHLDVYKRQAWRFVRQYGFVQLYRKVKERRDRNLAEKGYEEWLFHQLPDQEEDRRQRETEFPFSPLISILVPAYETPEPFLRQMIESVLKQSYGNLELCIADGSPSERVKSCLLYTSENDRGASGKAPGTEMYQLLRGEKIYH